MLLIPLPLDLGGPPPSLDEDGILRMVSLGLSLEEPIIPQQHIVSAFRIGHYHAQGDFHPINLDHLLSRSLTNWPRCTPIGQLPHDLLLGLDVQPCSSCHADINRCHRVARVDHHPVTGHPCNGTRHHERLCKLCTGLHWIDLLAVVLSLNIDLSDCSLRH